MPTSVLCCIACNLEKSVMPVKQFREGLCNKIAHILLQHQCIPSTGIAQAFVCRK